MTPQLGCERLFEDPRAHQLVAGRRVGLITNHSGVDSRLRATADRLHAAADVDLRMLFGPEHGIRGDAEDGVVVDSGVDPDTGVPTVSLYGERRQPGADELAEIDVLLYDIQDVGVRFYTYLYTLSLAMAAGGAADTPVVVLDRPNPLGGTVVEGNVLDPAFASFVGLFPIPVRYALTVGELAALFNRHFGLGADLHVVHMRGWRRGMRWLDTGLAWVPPSPNMPTPDTANVYPGTCFFEGTNISEGRGTTHPFEQVGAPGIDPSALSASLADLDLPGVAFRPVSFRPWHGKHAGQVCRGLHLHASHDDLFQPVRTGFHVLDRLRRLCGDAFSWRVGATGIHNFDKLAGTDQVRRALEAGTPVDDLIASWRQERSAFEALRRDVLHYPE